ncbi:sm-like protein LSM8 isoform X1 [Spinacia oleracea]|uniref:U6 snRNA-associated Sm-like protein LSm8 n=1 Tax=Spinacia oleracea TaxID=3562 RepID=A0A9R0JRD3_SPIOL|nr:sm-like protein LSM8 isoform X1 [Spinacia oleracea]
MATGPGLEPLVDQMISVITNDGRNIVGILKGFDQATNIILDESHERVFSTKVMADWLAWISEEGGQNSFGEDKGKKREKREEFNIFKNKKNNYVVFLKAF